jgi:hypothetical protein
MDEREMLLVLTICELLGKSFDAPEVERAYETAKETLRRAKESPRSAYVYFPPQQ